MQYVICTGNIGNRETKEWLETLAANKNSTIFVAGDCDEFPDMPETRTIKIGDFTIGVIHGHQVIPWGDMEALASVQRELDCDILVYGHTHASNIKAYDGKHFLNPGSATGAFSTISKDVVPSFMLMAIQGNQAVVYVYELVEGKQKVVQATFTKSGTEVVKKEEKKAEEEKKESTEKEMETPPQTTAKSSVDETEQLE